MPNPDPTMAAPVKVIKGIDRPRKKRSMMATTPIVSRFATEAVVGPSNPMRICV